MAVLWSRPTAFVDIRGWVTHLLQGDKDLSLSYRKKLEYDSLMRKITNKMHWFNFFY
jgi:hypothetical protein